MTQLAGSLDERNRQVVDAGAHKAALVPIDDEPRRSSPGARRVARSVMRDPTWRLRRAGVRRAQTLLPGASITATDAPGADRGARAVGLVFDRRCASAPRRGPVGSVRRRRCRRQRPPARHPLRAVGGPGRSHSGGDRPPDPGRAARRHGPRPLAALRAGPQPGRRAQPARRASRPTSSAASRTTCRRRSPASAPWPPSCAQTARSPSGAAPTSSRSRTRPIACGAWSASCWWRRASRRACFDAAAGGLRRSAARRAHVGGAARRSALRARGRAARRTSPSPIPTGWSRCCGRSSTTR